MAWPWRCKTMLARDPFSGRVFVFLAGAAT